MMLRRLVFSAASLWGLLLCAEALTENMPLNLATVRVVHWMVALSQLPGQPLTDQAQGELVSLAQSLADYDSPGSITYQALLVRHLAPLNARASDLEDLTRTSEKVRPMVKYWLGEAYHEQGDYEKAISTWAEAGAALPLGKLGGALGKAGRWQEAVAAYEASLESFDREIKVYLDLGSALVHMGRQDEAVQIYQRGIRIAPDNWGPYVYIGDIYRERKDFEQAQYWYHRGIQATGSAWPYIGSALIAEAQGAFDLAESRLRTALQVEPGNCEAWLRLGLLFQRQGKCAEAIVPLEEAVELSPRWWLYQALGDARRDCGALEGALQAYEAALEIVPDNNDLRRQITSVRQILDQE